MRLRIEAPTGSLGEFARDVERDLARAVTAAVSAATDGLKLQLRQQVAAAGLGERLGNAIGSNVYPGRGRFSLKAAGLVFPRGAGAEKIFKAFNEGVTIRAAGAGWLAIPTDNIPPLGRDAKRTPAAVEAFFGRPLRYVPPRAAAPGRSVALLVMDQVVKGRRRGFKTASRRRVAQGRKVESIVMFILVPSARLRQRLDFDAVAQEWADRIPELIDRALPES